MPGNTLAVVLGVTECPRATALDPIPQCERSAEDFISYLQDVVGLEEDEDVLDLFDSRKPASRQLSIIKDWLNNKIEARRNNEKNKIENVIFYYSGHGGFAADQSFILATRETTTDSEGGTSIRFSDLSTAIKMVARAERKYYILDCCYASSSIIRQSDLTTAVGVKLKHAVPGPGTAVYCSSSAKMYSMVVPGEPHTMFSGALLHCLKNGIADGPEILSLDDLKGPVLAYIEARYEEKAVRPELHIPDGSRGDPTKVKLFPNKEWKKEERDNPIVGGGNGNSPSTPEKMREREAAPLQIGDDADVNIRNHPPSAGRPAPGVEPIGRSVMTGVAEGVRPSKTVKQGPRISILGRNLLIGALSGSVSAIFNWKFLVPHLYEERALGLVYLIPTFLAVPFIFSTAFCIVIRLHRYYRISDYVLVFLGSISVWVIACRIIIESQSAASLMIVMITASIGSAALNCIIRGEFRIIHVSALLGISVVIAELVFNLFEGEIANISFSLMLFTSWQSAAIGSLAVLDRRTLFPPLIEKKYTWLDDARNIGLGFWMFSSLLMLSVFYLLLSDARIQRAIAIGVGDVRNPTISISNMYELEPDLSVVISSGNLSRYGLFCRAQLDDVKDKIPNYADFKLAPFQYLTDKLDFRGISSSDASSLLYVECYNKLIGNISPSPVKIERVVPDKPIDTSSSYPVETSQLSVSAAAVYDSHAGRLVVRYSVTRNDDMQRMCRLEGQLSGVGVLRSQPSSQIVLLNPVSTGRVAFAVPARTLPAEGALTVRIVCSDRIVGEDVASPWVTVSL